MLINALSIYQYTNAGFIFKNKGYVALIIQNCHLNETLFHALNFH